MFPVEEMQYIFWSKKVDHFISMFEYGKDTPEQFKNNMMLMGFTEENIQQALFEEEENE
jgi:hypothetical protein